MKQKLAMVDFDGTLIDTLEANYISYKTALNECGHDITREYYAQHCDGHSFRDFLPALLGEDSCMMERVHERKTAIYADHLQKTRVNEHLVNILRAIKPVYYIALVTTASKETVLRVLRYFSLENLFDKIVTREDMSRCKPAPDCYIETRNFFQVDWRDAVIFEDSNSGIRAALESKSPVFSFQNWARS